MLHAAASKEDQKVRAGVFVCELSTALSIVLLAFRVRLPVPILYIYLYIYICTLAVQYFMQMTSCKCKVVSWNSIRLCRFVSALYVYAYMFIPRMWMRRVWVDKCHLGTFNKRLQANANPHHSSSIYYTTPHTPLCTSSPSCKPHMRCARTQNIIHTLVLCILLSFENHRIILWYCSSCFKFAICECAQG